MRLIRITGGSMAPLIEDGDFALVGGKPVRPVEGDVALVDHPGFGTIVKCLGEQSADGFSLHSLAPGAVSTRALGVIDPACIRGCLLWRISPGGISRIRRGSQESSDGSSGRKCSTLPFMQ